jgi:hypothetical protein
MSVNAAVGQIGAAVGAQFTAQSNKFAALPGVMANRVAGAVSKRLGYPGTPGSQLKPGQEAPTPADIPQDDGNPNQTAMLAAILGGSALIGTVIGCMMFRNKRSADGDSDSDANSDEESDESD